MWVYRRVISTDGRTLFRCGFYDEIKTRESWVAVKDFENEDDAAAYVSYLNGGNLPKQVGGPNA